MKKQLAIAAGVLLTLGTAVAASLSDDALAVKSATSAESTAPQMGSKQTAQILALWKTHAGSSGSVPLARPL